MTFEDWQSQVPEELKEDTLWRVEAYRLGLFLSDLAWIDSGKLLTNRRTISVADQLFRAAGNISSNVAEGYSRDTGKARALFYQYAVGSARETRDWYFKARRTLANKVVTHRINLSTQIIRLTLKMCANERRFGRRASA
ncbi:MAG TPA: four helix bundle protein [Tepidisphaeraceae bacterium]|jgi:four helix bundle protein|nr:four helix bundle protein [Tepidisphaeraceae bacterium]